MPGFNCADEAVGLLNQTLHDVWRSTGLVHYIYTLTGALAL